MRAGRILRQIVIARLTANVGGVSGRVFDRATEGAAYPYITLGPSYWVDDSAECIKGRSQTVQVDIWNQDNKGVTEDIVDDVCAALDGWADAAALTMSPMRVSLVRVMDDPQAGVVHGIVQIEVSIEA